MAHQIELNPISHLTIGTVGSPGNRVFYLQGSQGMQTISLIIEKEQALVLAANFASFLEELEKEHPIKTREIGDPIWSDMRLREPVEELFRVGNMGLGYHDESDKVVLVAYELVDEGEDSNTVSFWATRTQVQMLSQHTHDVVNAGRPICGNCGQPMDAEGHFCANRNGHKH